MKINQVTPGVNTNFNGTLRWRGKTEIPEFMDALKKSSSVNRALSDNSIIANVKTGTRPFGEKVYKLFVSVEKDKPNFLEKIQYSLGLAPKKGITKNYHSVDTITNAIPGRISSVLDSMV